MTRYTQQCVVLLVLLWCVLSVISIGLTGAKVDISVVKPKNFNPMNALVFEITTTGTDLHGMKITPQSQQSDSDSDTWLFGVHNFLANFTHTTEDPIPNFEYPIGQQHVFAQQTALFYTPYSLNIYGCKVSNIGSLSFGSAHNNNNNFLFVEVNPAKKDQHGQFHGPSSLTLYTHGLDKILRAESLGDTPAAQQLRAEVLSATPFFGPDLSEINQSLTFTCLIPHLNTHWPTSDEFIVTQRDQSFRSLSTNEQQHQIEIVHLKVQNLKKNNDNNTIQQQFNEIQQQSLPEIKIISAHWKTVDKPQRDPFPIINLDLSFTSSQPGIVYLSTFDSNIPTVFNYANDMTQHRCKNSKTGKYYGIFQQLYHVYASGSTIFNPKFETTSSYISLPSSHDPNIIVKCTLAFKPRSAIRELQVSMSYNPLNYYRFLKEHHLGDQTPIIFPQQPIQYKVELPLPHNVLMNINNDNNYNLNNNHNDNSNVFSLINNNDNTLEIEQQFYINAFVPSIINDYGITSEDYTIILDIRSIYLTTRSFLSIQFQTNYELRKLPFDISQVTSCYEYDPTSTKYKKDIPISNALIQSGDEVTIQFAQSNDFVNLTMVRCEIMKGIYHFTTKQQVDRFYTTFSLWIDRVHIVQPYTSTFYDGHERHIGVYSKRHDISIGYVTTECSWDSNIKKDKQFKTTYKFTLQFPSKTQVPWSPILSFRFTRPGEFSYNRYEEDVLNNRWALKPKCIMSNQQDQISPEVKFDMHYIPKYTFGQTLVEQEVSDAGWVVEFHNYFINMNNQTRWDITSFVLSCDIYIPEVEYVAPMFITIADRWEQPNYLANYSLITGPMSIFKFPEMRPIIKDKRCPPVPPPTILNSYDYYMTTTPTTTLNDNNQNNNLSLYQLEQQQQQQYEQQQYEQEEEEEQQQQDLNNNFNNHIIEQESGNNNIQNNNNNKNIIKNNNPIINQICWENLYFQTNNPIYMMSTTEVIHGILTFFKHITTTIKGIELPLKYDDIIKDLYLEYQIIVPHGTTLQKTLSPSHLPVDNLNNVMSQIYILNQFHSRSWAFVGTILNSFGTRHVPMLFGTTLYKINILCIRDPSPLAKTSRLLRTLTKQQQFNILLTNLDYAIKQVNKDLDQYSTFQLSLAPYYEQMSLKLSSSSSSSSSHIQQLQQQDHDTVLKPNVYQRETPGNYNECGQDYIYSPVSTQKGSKKLCHLGQHCNIDLDCMQGYIWNPASPNEPPLVSICDPVSDTCVLSGISSVNSSQYHLFDLAHQNAFVNLNISKSDSIRYINGQDQLDWHSVISEFNVFRYFTLNKPIIPEKKPISIWLWFVFIILGFVLLAGLSYAAWRYFKHWREEKAYDNVNDYLVEYLDDPDHNHSINTLQLTPMD